MALIGPGKVQTPCIVEGICPGYIIQKPLGNNGFGYDPVFVPEGFTKTFAQLKQDEKNRISHRGKALLALKEKLYEIFRINL